MTTDHDTRNKRRDKDSQNAITIPPPPALRKRSNVRTNPGFYEISPMNRETSPDINPIYSVKTDIKLLNERLMVLTTTVEDLKGLIVDIDHHLFRSEKSVVKQLDNSRSFKTQVEGLGGGPTLDDLRESVKFTKLMKKGTWFIVGTVFIQIASLITAIIKGFLF